jgi:hypothetical protein
MPTFRIHRRAPLFGMGAAVGLVLVACNLLKTPNDNGSVETLLTESEASWTTSGIHNYEYDFQHSCDNCSGDSVVGVHVVVKKDVVTSVVRSDGTGAASAPLTAYATVLQMFAITQAALSANQSLIQATFNTQTGYPVFIQIVPKSGLYQVGNVYGVGNFVQDSL